MKIGAWQTAMFVLGHSISIFHHCQTHLEHTIALAISKIVYKKCQTCWSLSSCVCDLRQSHGCPAFKHLVLFLVYRAWDGVYFRVSREQIKYIDGRTQSSSGRASVPSACSRRGSMTGRGQRRIRQCWTHHTLPSRSATGCHLLCWDSLWL